jgi:general secretion pathway protein L
LLIDHQNAILRTGQWLGGGIEAEMLPIVLDKIRLDNPSLASLECWSASEPTQCLSELPFNLTHHTTDPSLLLLESAVTKLTGELNLLTSDFAQKNTQQVQWKKWLPALAIICVTALLQTGLLLNSYWQQKTQLASLETQTLSLFKQTFPEVKRIVNIKVQADQQLIDLQKQSTGSGSSFMSLLYQTGQVLNVNPGFEIRQLDYINDSLQVQLIAPTISQVEQVKQQLESSNQLSVKIQSAEANQKGVEVHYEIKQK